MSTIVGTRSVILNTGEIDCGGRMKIEWGDIPGGIRASGVMCSVRIYAEPDGYRAYAEDLFSMMANPDLDQEVFGPFADLESAKKRAEIWIKARSL